MKMKLLAALMLSLGALLFAGVSGCMAEVPRMPVDDLKARLGDSALALIDVRSSKDWEGSPIKIKGAVREDYNNPAAWASKYSKDKTIVLYCAWPKEGTSARVAQSLMDMGYTKVFALKGGWKEWEKAGYPTEPK